ncbi:MAG: type II toxin-antitoxin system VapC family toxin [Candidatus Aminicenantes bacterium]|nr:type II toxin-antitoxin system VapC family toxin [Candidatus Aminicenantes bacterium]
MFNKFLVDTDVLVDFLRGEEKAVDFVKRDSKKILISAITAAELYAAVRENGERRELDEFVEIFAVLPVTPGIAVKGGLFKRDFFKSFRIGLADAIIAATAEIHEADLKTLNSKHFPMFKGLKPPYKKGG